MKKRDGTWSSCFLLFVLSLISQSCREVGGRPVQSNETSRRAASLGGSLAAGGVILGGFKPSRSWGPQACVASAAPSWPPVEHSSCCLKSWAHFRHGCSQPIGGTASSRPQASSPLYSQRNSSAQLLKRGNDGSEMAGCRAGEAVGSEQSALNLRHLTCPPFPLHCRHRQQSMPVSHHLPT
jgi:hypothetical protein